MQPSLHLSTTFPIYQKPCGPAAPGLQMEWPYKTSTSPEQLPTLRSISFTACYSLYFPSYALSFFSSDDPVDPLKAFHSLPHRSLAHSFPQIRPGAVLFSINMYSPSSLLSFAALLAVANAHGVILGAQGLKGSPASVGFKVHSQIPRNCTSISPCQQDTTLIRDAEISANIVNECGRTELDGNIDIGENTENALADGAVTQVKKGSTVDVTIHQVNADGAGPYTCDVIAQGNNGVITFPNVTVADNVPGVNGFSQAKEEDFTIKVTMPDNLNCTGSSAGNICTVRCRNNALAGPFGGCFPVQQVDIKPTVLKPSDVDTLLSLEKVNAQVAQDIQDLPVALAANQAEGSDRGLKNAAAVSKLLQLSAASAAPAPTQTADQADAATTTAAGAGAVVTLGPGRGGSRGQGFGNHRGGNNNNNNNNKRRSAKRFAA
ncbi:hypothetical protein F4802DRAFT_560832 [Xylaria palmicola]|nr:hypothetical protein F4802DRAFT_560832 [Xylaria palmicola]